jgi:hypothetical protein
MMIGSLPGHPELVVGGLSDPLSRLLADTGPSPGG